MRTKLAGALVLGGALLVGGLPARAHHWFPGGSDQGIMLKGTVTKLDWINPHARLFVDVKGENGKVVNWRIETGSPNALVMRGWTRDSLKPGDRVTIEAFLLKSSPNFAVARSVVLPNGNTVFAGSHAGDK